MRWEKQYLEAVSLRDCDFTGASLQGTTFRDCDLRGAKFRGADLRGVGFGICAMDGADFKNANLRGATLIGPGIAGNFDGADLRGASLYNIEEGSCDPHHDPDLRRITYTRRTHWPSNFAPRSYGARLVKHRRPIASRHPGRARRFGERQSPTGKACVG